MFQLNCRHTFNCILWYNDQRITIHSSVKVSSVPNPVPVETANNKLDGFREETTLSLSKVCVLYKSCRVSKVI